MSHSPTPVPSTLSPKYPSPDISSRIPPYIYQSHSNFKPTTVSFIWLPCGELRSILLRRVRFGCPPWVWPFIWSIRPCCIAVCPFSPGSIFGSFTGPLTVCWFVIVRWFWDAGTFMIFHRVMRLVFTAFAMFWEVITWGVIFNDLKKLSSSHMTLMQQMPFTSQLILPCSY